MRDDAVGEVKRALSDPVRLCNLLGLTKGAQRQSQGLLISCPVHGDRTPSCSVTPGRQGGIRVRCFGCDWTGDALTLIAAVKQLDIRSQFREVLVEGATLGGLHSLVDVIRRGEDLPPRERRERQPPPEAEPGPEYPPADELGALWEAAREVQWDREACAMLVERRIDPVELDTRRLARVLPQAMTDLPAWARYHGRPWTVTGHRLLLRCFDASGVFRSVRAWRVNDTDAPKRLPPAGCRASGIALANRKAVGMLLGAVSPPSLTVVEGEPDFATVATQKNGAIVGVGSGSWTAEFAERVPRTCDVLIWTHPDQAGDRYADAVMKSLGERCRVWRAA